MAIATASGAPQGAGWTLPRLSAAKVSFPWLPLLPLLAIPFLGTSPSGLERVIIAMQLTFLVMGVRRPVWVLGALALAELSIRNHMLILPAAMFVPLPHLIREATPGPRAKPMFVAAAAFLALTSATTFILLDTRDVISYVLSTAPDILLVALIPLVIRNRRDLLEAGLVLVAVGIATAGVGIAQQVGGARFLAVPHHTVVNTDNVDWGARSIGLDLNPILYTDHLMLVLYPVLGVVLARATSWKMTVALVAVAIVLGIGLFCGGTRSWILGSGAAMLGMALATRGRLRIELVAVLLIAAASVWVIGEHSTGRYSLGFDSDGSAAARPVLWSAGFQMALDHPVVGVGPDQFMELSPRYASSISGGLLERQNVSSVLGRLSPHNDFLNIWLSFGTGALVLYALLIAFTAGNFIRAAHTTSDPVLRGIAIGCLGALAAFAVNSFFHNLLTSALSFWILAGVSLALTKVVSQEEAAS